MADFIPDRNFNDPEYKKWRKKVYARDKYTCQMCHSKKKLQAHHIKRWAQYPALRFIVDNGITLCGPCHKRIWGKEEQYEQMFMDLLNPKDKLYILRIMYGKKK
jgi:5-methylcytosine-specific restriction endonuclease McrA